MSPDDLEKPPTPEQEARDRRAANIFLLVAGALLVGINYKDQPDNARRFIGRYGNPFTAVGADANGRASIDWGVYGVPETFVIDREGRIAYKLVGPITPANLEAALKPQIEKALQSP